MSVDLDSVDWRILHELQLDGRVSITELARRVNLGATATSDRVKRLETSGVISGYQAHVDLVAVGLPIQAVIRLQYTLRRHAPFREHLAERREILECQRISGEDCYFIKVAAESTAHLEEIVDELSQFGHTTTSVIYSETLGYRGPTSARTLSATRI